MYSILNAVNLKYYMNSLKNQEFILDKNIFFKFCTNLWTKIWGKELPPKEEATRGRITFLNFQNPNTGMTRRKKCMLIY